MISVKFKYINSEETRVKVRHEGFTADNQSLLSLSMPLCKNPGSFFSSLIKMRSQLLNGQIHDISWDTWLLRHFNVANADISDKSSIKAFYQLQGLIRSKDLGIDFLDILMFAQIEDCYILMSFA